MRNIISIVVAMLLCGMATACHRRDPSYCLGANPDNNCLAPDASKLCTGNAECSAPLPVCDVGTMTCIQCTADEPAACTGATPVCGGGHACRACTAHAECSASEVCLPDGRCADLGEVAYVMAGGAGAPPCTKQAPCGTLQEGITAVDASRPYIRIVGTGTLVDDKTTVIDGKAVTIFADPGAKLGRTGDGVILEVRNTGANVQIYDLEITREGNISTLGISVAAGGMPALKLVRAKVTDNDGGGIVANSGTLTVSQSTIRQNGIGIFADGAALTVSRSRIAGNQNGGISAKGPFVIVGNMIYANGSNLSPVGGLDISAPASDANRLEFNSIARNFTLSFPSAILCNVAGSFTARNNIISENIAVMSGLQVGGTCRHAYSIVPAGGAGNSDVDPLFVSSVNDLHITAGSPARGTADPSSDLTGLVERDLDGDVRVRPVDIGADQVR
jgi:hypothetical protein